MDIKKYLSGNKVSEIRVGQSGANVYEINGEQILKHVQRNMFFHFYNNKGAPLEPAPEL